MGIAKTTRNVYTRRMKPTKHIRTQGDIVAAFRAVYAQGTRTDGKRAMADWLGLSHQAVCNWFMTPSHGGEPLGIPNGYQGRFMLWAAYHGYVLHPSAFGLRSDGKPMARSANKAA